MIIFYSGCGSRAADPEHILKDEAQIMMTFWELKEKRTNRFKRILRKRLKRRKQK